MVEDTVSDRSSEVGARIKRMINRMEKNLPIMNNLQKIFGEDLILDPRRAMVLPSEESIFTSDTLLVKFYI